MMRLKASILALAIASMIFGVAGAEDDQGVVPYIQFASFNVPQLEGWENQSSDDFAQFRYAEAGATIRTALSNLGDPVAAAESELDSVFNIEPGQAIYQDKVNLADGTWTVLVYEPNALTSASVMARRVATKTVVVSFVENDPDARILMLTIAQSGNQREDASSEIDLAVGQLATAEFGDSGDSSRLSLPGGEWMQVAGEGALALGMVFGNDSYLAIGEGETEHLSLLADAYNRTVLGFFVTPDNSIYLALALAAVFAILALLILSYVWRSRGIQKDLEMIETLQQADG